MLANFGALENSLLGQVQHLQREIEKSFLERPRASIRQGVSRNNILPVNIASSGNGVDIFFYVSGLDAQTIDVSVKDDVLSVVAERLNPVADNGKTRLQERRAGKINQKLTLPDNLNSESAEAKYNDGVLHISIARREEDKPHKITVQ